MRPLEPPIRPLSTLHREFEEIPRSHAGSFLSAFEGQPRGFWGSRDRWFAWAGVLGRIRVPHDGAQDRFDLVRSTAARILEASGQGSRAEPERGRLRFFGGFSFLGTGSRDSGWERFASADFVLPRFVLEGEADRTRLLAMDLETAGVDESAVDALVARLRGAPQPSRARPAPEACWKSVEDPGAHRRWKAAVRRALERVEDGTIRKVVLARTFDVAFEREVNTLESLSFLRHENRRAHVYFVEPAPGRVFMGASPEVLAHLEGGRFQATAVAGSIRRGATPEEDSELARRLLTSRKDGIEHRLTAQEMVEVLEPRLLRMEVEDTPRVLKLARIQHLETAIRGLAGPGEDILSLVRSLHPTPAVCGRPRAAAQELIREAEPFDRGWYAAPMGWFDSEGDGTFVPALRATVGGATRWRLFAGAGIVAGSDPEAEWEETGLKFEPALRALSGGAASNR